MTKIYITFIILLFKTTFSFSQNCDCEANFEWVKKTFEENDAGFQYVIKNKGNQAYIDHNKRILYKVQNTKTLTECTQILYKWLTFFRLGHIDIRLNEETLQNNDTKLEEKFFDWETYSIKTENFKKYLDKNEISDYEGIWETKPYKIGIKKEEGKYIGFIIESGVETWTKGQVKLKFNIEEDKANSVFYMRDHSAVESENVEMIGKKYLQIGNSFLTRIYPEMNDDPKYERYIKQQNSSNPYLEQLNETTLYFKIPSMNLAYKNQIDSILHVNRLKILETENLIIDIRNNGGGSDATYEEVLPFIYTNPISKVGVEFLSTELNNQRMLNLINPEYGFDEKTRKILRIAYERLNKNIGNFVNIEDSIINYIKYDTIYSYPKNVGVIINNQNASSAEQFLLDIKQSKKVKLFGTTTFGALDMANMHFVLSPSNEFYLGYCLSKSLRLPDFSIDDIGIQPDYYIDKSISPYDWIEFVNEKLNER